MIGGVDMARSRLRIGQGWLLMVCVVLGACASDGQSRQSKRIDARDIARLAGCDHDEVAICIEIDCQPDEYRCAARDDVVALFKAREFRH